MIKNFSKIISIFSLFFILGCGDNKTVVGEWEFIDGNKTVYIEISNDGKCIGKESRRAYKGTWKEDKNGFITLSFPAATLEVQLTTEGLMMKERNKDRSIILKRK
ncbi:MAG: hypothetical protein KAG98_00850 [Lentisphaeria bacterium]|nr:hypothetical protein [Lentisphaeria bacterium]